MDFVRYNDKESIEKLLADFADVFPSLMCDSLMLTRLADKLFSYGIVECLQNNGEQCAYAGFYCNDIENKTAYISMIATSVKYRGQGYGQAMLDRVCEISRGNDMRKIRLEVRNDNSTALNFYKRNGFVFEKTAGDETQYMIKTL